MTRLSGATSEFRWMDLKTHDIAGTEAFFSTVLGWRFAVDEEDWRRAIRITRDGHQIGGLSDLSNPIYPHGIPAHVAYYLAVEDVDRRTELATTRGAQLVLAPFDAGDQGRIATLIDPFGAAFSLWQPSGFTGWTFPANSAYAPRRMVLECEHADQARDFYRDALGMAPDAADFVTAGGSGESAPQWEVAIGVDDLDGIASRAREHGKGSLTWSEHAGRRRMRLRGPDGLTLRVRSLRD